MLWNGRQIETIDEIDGFIHFLNNEELKKLLELVCNEIERNYESMQSKIAPDALIVYFEKQKKQAVLAVEQCSRLLANDSAGLKIKKHQAGYAKELQEERADQLVKDKQFYKTLRPLALASVALGIPLLITAASALLVLLFAPLLGVYSGLLSLIFIIPLFVFSERYENWLFGLMNNINSNLDNALIESGEFIKDLDDNLNLLNQQIKLCEEYPNAANKAELYDGYIKQFKFILEEKDLLDEKLLPTDDLVRKVHFSDNISVSNLVTHSLFKPDNDSDTSSDLGSEDPIIVVDPNLNENLVSNHHI